jgi:hypothetical protein
MNEKQIRGLIEPRNFIAAWFAELPKHDTYEKAYEAVEIIFEDYFGKRKYSGYESFKQVRMKIYKSNKK